MKPAPRFTVTPIARQPDFRVIIADFAKDMAAFAGLLVFLTAVCGLLIAIKI